MDELQSRLQLDKEAKKKRLLELQAAKRAREEDQKNREEQTHRAFPRPGETPVDELISRVLNAPRASEVPQTVVAVPAASPLRQVKSCLTMETTAESILPRVKAMMYEREIQVDDLTAGNKGEDDDVDEGVQHEPQTKQKGVRLVQGHGKADLQPGKAGEEPADRMNTELVIASAEFNDFFTKSSRLVERALGQEFDICGNDTEEETKEGVELTHVLDFIEPAITNRCIGALQWSPAHEELLLASYSLAGREAPGDPQGTVKVWSLSLRHRPEFSLYCQSTVTSAIFNQFDHNLILGGLYSGRLVIWDLRAKTTPVQRTPMVAEAHSQPISTLQITGSQNANNVVSLSSDGKVCVWSTSMLSQPTSSIEVKQKTKDMACLALAFPDNETNAFYVGMEDGSVVYSQLLASKMVESAIDTLEAHTGPITALDMHKVGDNLYSEGAGNLMLSSSVDWTVKLWNTKISRNPILSFENYEDYVYDVKWSPSNPSIFAACDGDGNLDVWNLASSTENPEYREKGSTCALNRLGWSSRGLRLAAGSSKGLISIYEIDSDHLQGKPSDWSELEQQLSL